MAALAALDASPLTGGALNFGVFPEEYKLEIDNKEVVYYDVEANEIRLDGTSITKDLNKRLKRSKGLVSS